jgi:hypothetical protein
MFTPMFILYSGIRQILNYQQAPDCLKTSSDLLMQLNTFWLFWICFREGGGKAFLQHLALRLVLLCHKYAPIRYDFRLNYCTERRLIQRIGGRYRFIHRHLQEYFANMNID